MRYGDYHETTSLKRANFKPADFVSFLGIATLSVLEGIIFIIVIVSAYHKFG